MRAKEPISNTSAASVMAMEVAPSTSAAIDTSATAMAPCASADTIASLAPLRAVSRLARTQAETTALPWPGPAAWSTP